MASNADNTGFVIGIISDTHGLLRDEAVDALKGVDIILHAGDIDIPDVLDGLRSVVPLVAVRGNMDFGRLRKELPENDIVDTAGHLIYMIHEIHRIDLDPVAAGISAVVYGHSHRPNIETRQGVLFINPGSAGPRRFNYPVTVARLMIRDGRLDVEIVDVDRQTKIMGS